MIGGHRDTYSQCGALPGLRRGAPLADLDWATGLTRFFVDTETFLHTLGHHSGSPDADDRYELEAITHESTHLLQLCLTGFAYDFSYRLLQTVRLATQENSTLEAIYDNRGAYFARLAPLFQSLERKGPEGVTTRSILESAAYLAQKQTHYELGLATFEQFLADEVLDGDYRNAFDVAAQYLGSDALDYFPHIANLALTTREPETVLVPLIKAFKSSASRIDIERNHRLGLQLLNQDFRNILIGSASDLYFDAGMQHSILGRVVLGVNELANENKLRPITLFARGRVYDDRTAALIAAPCSFPPTPATGGTSPVWVPDAWKKLNPGDISEQIGAYRFLSAASIILQQDLPDVVPAPFRDGRRVRPSDTQLNMPTGVRLWEFKRENRTTETADHFCNLLSDISSDAEKSRTLRGTVFVAFPDDEFPGGASPLFDTSVQELLRRLFSGVPHLLYFISDTAEAVGILSAVAAFHPESLVRGIDGAPAAKVSPEVLYMIATLLRAAALFAEECGQRREVVLGHLENLPSELSQGLRAFVLA